MQLVDTGRDTLLRPLQTVTGIVERRLTLPILANILIRKEGNAVTFLSSDTEVQITTHADVGKGESTVETTVAARKLYDILRALPDSADVTLTLSDKRLTVESGKTRFQLQTLAAEDFPVVKETGEHVMRLELPQKALKSLLGKVHFAMAHQDLRYFLNGVLLIAEGNTLSAVATDAHRMAYAQIEVDAEYERHSAIIPRKTVLEMHRLLEENDSMVTVDISDTQVKFSFSDTVMISKLIEGKFPDHTNVVPRGYKNRLKVPREDLHRALQRAAILTTDKSKGVRCVVDAAGLKISSTNLEQEEAFDELSLEYVGDEIDIIFNISFLLDVVTNHKDDFFVIEFGDSRSSALITAPDSPTFKYVVMPMRM